MNTLKTAVVVVVLLGVLYGVYQVLNSPDQQLIDGRLLPSFGSATAEQGSAPAVDLGHLEPGAPDSPHGYSDLQIGLPPDEDTGRNGGAPTMISPQDLVPADAGPVALRAPGREGSTVESPAAETYPPPLPPNDQEQEQDARQSTGSSEPASSDAESFEHATNRFERALELAREQINASDYREALATLSPFYDLPGLDQQQQRELLSYLDPLAGKVIYSMEHRLEAPYIVRSGDTLEVLAGRHDVGPKLIENINKSGINDPRVLLPGTELKVVRGPFRAEIRLDKKRLTVFLNELYAGRFDIDVANDRAPRDGVYRVKDKRQWQEFYTRSGQTIPKGHPANPYGQWWIDLGSEVSIHGTAEVNDPKKPQGCISLSPIDAADVYAILSEGSRVEIRR